MQTPSSSLTKSCTSKQPPGSSCKRVNFLCCGSLPMLPVHALVVFANKLCDGRATRSYNILSHKYGVLAENSSKPPPQGKPFRPFESRYDGSSTLAPQQESS